jgi:hypothetical protein
VSALSRFISGAARSFGPIATAVTPGPAKGITKIITNELAAGEEARRLEAKNRIYEENRRKNMAEIFQGSNLSSIQPSVIGSTTANAGNMGFFGGLNNFFKGAGEVLGSAFGSGIPQLFGVGRPRGTINQPALTTVTNVGAQESQGSGSIQAGFGSLIPSLVGAGRSLIGSPLGQIGIGTAVGGALSLIDSMGKQVRITRKTKRLAQQAYQLSFGDLSSATALFAQLSGISVNEMQFVQILTKRFRNDGPVITKAAVRKTRSTLRKMKNMCDMYNSVAKAPARRRSMPMKRATTTLIKN